MKMFAAVMRKHLSPDAASFMRHALPNSVTILALCFGLTGLIHAARQNFVATIACILIAALLDACDGRVARATGATSRFGAELDSLADVVCFGAVPAFTIYVWGLSQIGGLGWIICLCLAGACALRLARFNVASADASAPAWRNQFFSGIPAPGGAFLALAPVYAEHAGLLDKSDAVVLACGVVPGVAALMVSTFPTFSAKAISRKVLRLWFVPTMMLTALALFGLVTAPWLTLTLGAVVYVATLPLSKLRFSRYANQ